MDLSLIASITGLSISSISAIFQGIQTFRQSNMEKYFGKLAEEGRSLTPIGENKELEARFYYIIDQVAKERNWKKITAWKNATISLATDQINYDEIDSHLRTLEYITHFDLTILYKIYTTNFKKVNFQDELFLFFEDKGVSREGLKQSLKALSLHNLIGEQFEGTAMLAGAQANLQDFHYSKNDLGRRFLKFVSSDIVMQQ